MAFRILIVDDSRAMRSFIRRVLDLSGLDVSLCLEAGDGLEALDVLARESVDVVLTDINMPRMNGPQFLEKVAQNHLWRSIPVLVVSTDATDQRMEQMLALGAQGYIKKPFTPELLRDQLERALGAVHD